MCKNGEGSNIKSFLFPVFIWFKSVFDQYFLLFRWRSAVTSRRFNLIYCQSVQSRSLKSALKYFNSVNQIIISFFCKQDLTEWRLTHLKWRLIEFSYRKMQFSRRQKKKETKSLFLHSVCRLTESYLCTRNIGGSDLTSSKYLYHFEYSLKLFDMSQ